MRSEVIDVDSSPLNSGPGIYCWRVGGQLIYYLPYFISLNVKTVFYLIVIKNRKRKRRGYLSVYTVDRDS